MVTSAKVLDELRVADVVRDKARSRPDAAAIRHEDRAITYAELDDRSNRLADVLLTAGAGAGSRIAHLDRSAPEVVELLAAASKIGAAAVPLNWRLAAPELTAIVADSGAPLLIAGPAFADVAAEVAASVPQHLEIVGVDDDYEGRLASAGASDPGGRGAADDPVLQMYTSGTTGVPKGVLTTHRNLAAATLNVPSWRFDEASVSLTPLPMFHVGGIGWTYLGLSQGAATIVVSEFDAEAVLDLLESARVTNAVFVPTILQLLTSVPGAAERDFSALRSIAYGASPITTPVLKAALRTFRCPLFGVYGLTETTGGVVQLEPEDHDPDGPREHLLRSAGRPRPWMQLRVVDPTSGRELPAGRVGEVWMRGPNVMAGYANRPEETAAALTPDGWLRTGDGGYVDEDGYLFLTDRIKDMIVSGGENVYPVEVEEALSHHPAVAEVAVVGVPDERWGELVKALVVVRPGAVTSTDELVAFGRERLAGYKLPRSVDFVEDLPRNPSGKVLKHELRARYRGVAAGARRDHAGQPPAAAMTAEIGLVLIGPPGVGKGTQAAHLREEFDLAHIATGDLLREHRARGTALGRQAAECMTAGGLVPDDLVVAMVEERIRASPRFLLDGFPRTVAQAHALGDLLKRLGRGLTAAVFIDAPDETVIERIAGRADARDDDDLATVRRCLEQFHHSTAPVIDHYARLGLLHRIDASRRVEEVYGDARALLVKLCEDFAAMRSPNPVSG